MMPWTYTLKIKTLNQSNTYKNENKPCIQKLENKTEKTIK